MNFFISIFRLQIAIVSPILVLFCHSSLHQKPYFSSPGISWKAQKDQVNIIFPSTFWLTERPYFAFLKNSKQELFSNQ